MKPPPLPAPRLVSLRTAQNDVICNPMVELLYLVLQTTCTLLVLGHRGRQYSLVRSLGFYIVHLEGGGMGDYLFFYSVYDFQSCKC